MATAPTDDTGHMPTISEIPTIPASLTRDHSNISYRKRTGSLGPEDVSGNPDLNHYLPHSRPRALSHVPRLHKMRTSLGLEAEAPVNEHHLLAHDESKLWWPHIRYLLREPFAEFWGTFILILFGDGSVAQVLTSTGIPNAGGTGWGNYQSINWCWGIGVALGIYVAGDSGGFLNPAITFAFCLFRGLSWKRFPIYLVAQFLGGFLGAGVVYINYYQAISNYEGGDFRTVPPAANATAGIFCTYPQSFLGKGNQFLSELIASSILQFVVFALKDDSNAGAMGKSGSGPFFPLILLFLIFGIGAAWGYDTGYAINLARDFGPRLMSYAIGYGTEVWSAGDYYFWVPIVASFCGCFLGGLFYDLFIYSGPDSPINQPRFGIDRYRWGKNRRQSLHYEPPAKAEDSA